MSQTIAKDQTVYLTYSILADNGEILERSDIPVGYVHGSPASGLFPKVEAALTGHAEGEHIEVRLSPDEAFGVPQEELVWTDDIENVPPEYRQIGAEATFANEQGETKIFRVTRIENGQLTLDGNHPFAGQAITFAVDIQKVRDATSEEISAGHPADSFGSGLQ